MNRQLNIDREIDSNASASLRNFLRMLIRVFVFFKLHICLLYFLGSTHDIDIAKGMGLRINERESAVLGLSRRKASAEEMLMICAERLY